MSDLFIASRKAIPHDGSRRMLTAGRMGQAPWVTATQADEVTASAWREHFPRGVLDPCGPSGEPIFTSTDRRMLWHLEGWLAVSAPGGGGDLRLALYRYLCETCEHHWRDYAEDVARRPDTGEVDSVIPAHRQCLWCSEVEWAGGLA